MSLYDDVVLGDAFQIRFFEQFTVDSKHVQQWISKGWFFLAPSESPLQMSV